MRMLAYIREIETGVFEAHYDLGPDAPVAMIVENEQKFSSKADAVAWIRKIAVDNKVADDALIIKWEC